MDISHGEEIEAQLNAVIARSHAKRVKEEGERASEELWRASERRHAEKQREENREHQR